MNTKIMSLMVLALVALFVIGCGSSPTPTPAPTQPPLVITVVITPTPLPPTATRAQPTLTPIPTFPLTSTVPTVLPGTTQAVSSAPAATKPPVVRTPTKPGATVTSTALPLRFAAPGLIEPLWEPPWNTVQKDEVKFPGSAMIFKWRAAGGLGSDECYLLNISSEPVNANLPPRADYFLVNCGDQTRLDYSVQPPFTLFQPGKGGPSYASLMMDASELWVSWTITVVKNLGQCVDQYHCKSAPLSPASYRGRFLFKGG